ncbi:transporter substrate-binding domain-containing protein [Vibrio sp. JC009]|uniref:transporter substrate-binding domain-containing protein n=1 Tax=Vibrio sp. JC009 TaxID=2912314 RepID=UPI0023B05506|nr:transporter substrate-binding domain-containing protein [Vibrio sp. JC009]WED23220.1 transporter substrate-binding domain-containing protein [Vibrio sp. JC009]
MVFFLKQLTHFSLLFVTALLLFSITGVQAQTSNTSESLVFSVHQPEGTPSFRGLSRVYSELFSRVGINAKLKYVPAARSTSLAQSGALDGQAGRAASYNGTTNQLRVPVPLYSLNLRAYVHRSSTNQSLDGWESLAGKSLKVEYMRGASLPKKHVSSLIPANNITTVTTIEQGFRKLKAGRTDVFIASDLSAWPFISSPEFVNDIVQAGLMESTDFYPYLDAKHKMLIPALARAITEMKQEGLIEQYMYQAFGSNVLVIDSYHATFPWTMECRKGFLENIDPKFNVTFHELDTKRVHRDKHEQQADKAWDKIVEQSPDIVVTMDDNALRLLGQRISDAGISLVFMGVNNEPTEYFNDDFLPLNVTGVVERPLLRANVNTIYQLLPKKHKRILVMMDNGVTTQAVANTLFGGQNEFHMGDIVVELWTTNTFEKWKNKVEQLSSGHFDALIVGSYANLVDESNAHVPDSVISQWTNTHSQKPIFSFTTNGVGKNKAIGGIVISGYDQGAGAADAVNIILERGKAPYVSLPKNGIYLFSESELSRWKIKIPDNLKRRIQLVE